MMEQGKSMEVQELLPCPFCGSEAKLHVVTRWAFCNECGAEGPETRDQSAAIAAWNTRTPDASKDAAIATLKGAVQADVAEFSRDSATLEAQAEQIRVLREAIIKILALFTDEPKLHLRPNDPAYRMTYGDSDRVDAAFDALNAALASTAPVAAKKEGEQ